MEYVSRCEEKMATVSGHAGHSHRNMTYLTACNEINVSLSEQPRERQLVADGHCPLHT